MLEKDFSVLLAAVVTLFFLTLNKIYVLQTGNILTNGNHQFQNKRERFFGDYFKFFHGTLQIYVAHPLGVHLRA